MSATDFLAKVVVSLRAAPSSAINSTFSIRRKNRAFFVRFARRGDIEANPHSQSDIRNRDRLSYCHLSTLHGARSSYAGGDLPFGEADKLSFAHFGFLSCLCQRLNESVCVLINDKRSDGTVKGLPESVWRCGAVDATRKEFVPGEGVHRPIVIRTELVLIDIGPGGDRTFERIKGLLSVPAPTDL